MAAFNGKLKKLAIKTGVGKRGAWALYSGKIEAADGNEYPDWVSFGFQDPKLTEGNWYAIEAEKDDKGYFKVKSVAPMEPPKASTIPAAAAKAVLGTPKDSFIHFQSARKDALEFVKLAVSLDALPLIQTKGKAGEAKRFEEVAALVNKMTVQFYFDTNTLRLLESVEDAGNVDSDDAEEEIVAAPGEED